MFWRGDPKPAPVTLHIYAPSPNSFECETEFEDLGTQFSGVNAVCKAIGTGAFHAGDLRVTVTQVD